MALCVGVVSGSHHTLLVSIETGRSLALCLGDAPFSNQNSTLNGIVRWSCFGFTSHSPCFNPNSTLNGIVRWSCFGFASHSPCFNRNGTLTGIVLGRRSFLQSKQHAEWHCALELFRVHITLSLLQSKQHAEWHCALELFRVRITLSLFQSKRDAHWHCAWETLLSPIKTAR